jgi:hypothetical protein
MQIRNRLEPRSLQLKIVRVGFDQTQLTVDHTVQVIVESVVAHFFSRREYVMGSFEKIAQIWLVRVR